MDNQLEEIIVKSFFVKRIRKRAIFELFSSQRRKDALSRLSNGREVLIEKYMIEIPKPNSDPEYIASLLKSHGARKTCYVISWNEEIDGKYLPLETALNQAVGYGMPSLISCIPGKLAYLETEQCDGPPPRYILKRG
jgi:hypothetical protein